VDSLSEETEHHFGDFGYRHPGLSDRGVLENQEEAKVTSEELHEAADCLA